VDVLLGEKDLDLSCQDVNGFSRLIYSILLCRAGLTKMLLGHPRPISIYEIVQIERPFGMPCERKVKTSFNFFWKTKQVPE
jgi:hypothetical protein